MIAQEEVSAGDDGFIIGDHEILYFNTLESLPDRGKLEADLVVDCTARATTRTGAQAHLERGAKIYIINYDCFIPP